MTKLTKAVARKVLATVDAGLTPNMGNPVPGQMCVEAAVCYALGLPHSDKPDCVAISLNRLKIIINDAYGWVSNESRAKGLRKLAILQLGTAGILDEVEFAQRLVPLAYDMANRAVADAAYAYADGAAAAARAAARAAAYAAADAVAVVAAAAADAAARAAAAAARAAARAAAYAAYAGEAELVYFCDKVADILIDMKVPAVKWLNIL
jgi:hypothetical protein